MRSFVLGIIGCGVISRTYLSDIRAFYPELHVKACADNNLEAAKKLAHEVGNLASMTVDELLSDDEIEIVINLTPPGVHVELNKRIIEAGKHVFSEKPFAPDYASAMEVVNLAREKNVYVACAPDTFLSSGLASVRHYIDSGLIGKPFMATANMMSFGVETWHPNPLPFYQKDTGPIYDMGPYYISALVGLFGPVEQITALSSRPVGTRHVYKGLEAGEDIDSEVDTTYAAILRFAEGQIANLNISVDIYKSTLPKLEIYGDQGTINYPDPNFGGGNPWAYRKEQFLDCVFNDTKEAKERSEKCMELPEVYPRYKDYSRGIGVYDLAYSIENGIEARCSGDFLLHVTEVLEGITKSAKDGTTYRLQSSCKRPAPTSVGEVVAR